MGTSLAIAWFTLLAVPPTAVIAFLVANKSRPALIKRLAIGCAVLIVGVVGSARLDISLMSNAANLVCLSAAYLAYAFLATCLWRVRSLFLRVPALLIAAAPIAGGYVMGTMGFLGLAFILADFANPPLQTVRMAAGLECRIQAWGNAISDTGYTVYLYRQWPLVPFVEREVSKVRVNETNPGTGPTAASCKDALAAMR